MIVQNEETIKKRYNVFLIVLMILLCVIGFVLIASASNILDTGKYKLVVSQVIWFCLGFVLFFVFSIIDYRILTNFYVIIYLIMIGLLLYVDINGINVLGGQRWIKIGPLSFQPSEISKLLIVIFFAKAVSMQENINTFKNLAKVLFFAIIPIVFVLKQPDLGTASVFVAIIVTILFVAGLSLRYFYIAMGALAVFIPIAWEFILLDYQKDRVRILFNPELDPLGKGWQVMYSKIAIGSGKLFGKGLFMGTINRLNYLPVKESDFIFGVAGEEIGFVGCIVIIVLYSLLIINLIKIASDCKDKIGSYIVAGIAGMFGFQMFVNIAMTLGIMPVTGIPLPFISYGGSSMLTSMASLGIVQNIYRENIKTMF
ncbi:rod shape-determining protein RodA [Caldicellulosiruptor changbaiensis]|uniref:Peptidoglycan glycosyltransferase RodA n=1 Tax=Caldicellulosiruptor changbaiensis TaxID=1222016 RepID=A0A3T0D5R0_9FIRM|nr:rod shape-determining protein RodA [Caldicellulosiruptor changbaiensis]AZT90399.1 rod shape-determining protein RodA [Caldicellulosiruptor changbaiensis]